MVNSRLEAVEKHVENSFTARKIAIDLSIAIADEIEALATVIKDSGDLYSVYGGMMRAATIIRSIEENTDV